MGIALAALLAVPVALLIVSSGWDGVYGQDAYHYHGFATGELRSALFALRPPAPFTWPPGFPVLTALVSLVTGPSTAAGQVVSLASGAIVPVATWALARELRPWTGRTPAWVAVLAGVLVACTPHLWQSAAVVMSDTTGLAAMTLGAWALVRWANGAPQRWAVLAAGTVAFAIDTRQGYALAGLPLAVAGVVVGVRRARVPGGPGLLATLALPLLAGALVLAPMVGPMAWSALRGEPVPFAIQLDSHPWDPGNLFRTEIVSRDGLGRWDLPMGVFYLTEPARAYHLGAFFALLAVGGALVVLRRPNVVAIATLIGWPALVLGFLGGDVTQNTRFALAVLPPVAILAAIGIGRVQAWVDAIRWPRRVPGRVLPAIAVVGAVAVMLIGGLRVTSGFIDRFERDRAAIAALAARIPAEDRIIAFQSTLALRFLGREALELYDLAADAAVALVDDGRPTWLLVPVDADGARWADASPGRSLAAIRGGPGLEAVEAEGAWGLWRVAPDAGGGEGPGAEPAARVTAVAPMMCRPC